MKNIIELSEKVINGGKLREDEALAILKAKGSELSLFFAGAHRIKEHFLGDKIDLCSIINAKSGRCAENCSFCAQSAHSRTDAPVYPIVSNEDIIEGAKNAAMENSHCFGIVTSGSRVTKGEEFDRILKAIREIRETLDIEPSASLGILDRERALELAQAGCVTYHHNLETSRSFFPSICTTHDYEDDVETVRHAKEAGMKVCCGGIFGLGESPAQRVELALTIRELDVNSIPINFLRPIEGTPLENADYLTPLDCLRIVALFRYVNPDKQISVCGGREHNLRDFQSWIFLAGASGTMVGNYLTTKGRNREDDLRMFRDGELEISKT